MEQVTIEFSIENLLFITIMLQIQDYLIDNNYWPWKISPSIDDNMNMIGRGKRIVLPKNIIPISPIVSVLSGNSNSINININHFSKNTSRKGPKTKMDKNNYIMFIDCYSQLYKQYIEENKAPFEINISHENRQKMKYFAQHLQSIKTNIYMNSRNNSVTIDVNDKNTYTIHENISKDFKSLDQEEFCKLWQSLNNVCDEIMDLLIFAFVRCHDRMGC